MTFADRLSIEVAREEIEVSGGTDLLPGDEVHVPLKPEEVPPVVDIEYTEHLDIRYLHLTREAGQNVAVYGIAEREVPDALHSAP